MKSAKVRIFIVVERLYKSWFGQRAHQRINTETFNMVCHWVFLRDLVCIEEVECRCCWMVVL